MNKKRKGGKSKARKPKFLSLRLQFPVINKNENLKKNIIRVVEEEEDRDSNNYHDENDVARFFSAADGGATSLTGLLDASADVTSDSSRIVNNNNNSRMDDLSPSSASLTYAYGGRQDSGEDALVRNALRSRDRDSSEEKWVCYSEVVEVKKEDEVSSSAAAVDARNQRLSLKLDNHQEILNAWSDKSPLYVDSADRSSQIVPDVNDVDLLSHEGSINNNGMMSWGNKAGVWAVPEMVGEIENGELRMKREEEFMRIGQREASMLRYKEKRRNRLFSRTIRYEVRKLNAEKRPRLKGRFVKRS